MHGGSPRGRGDGDSRLARLSSIVSNSLLGRPAWVVATLFVFVLLVVGTGVVVAQSGSVLGGPEMDVQTPDNQFGAGDERQLQLQITNDGEVYSDGTHPPGAERRVTEARSVRVNITDTDNIPFETTTNRQTLGTVRNGQTVGTTFGIVVADDADPGRYEMEVEVEYQNAREIEYDRLGPNEYQYEETVSSQTETVDVTLVVEDEPRFEIDDVDHDVQVDEQGNTTVTITNNGTENATETVVTASSTDENLFFGNGSPQSETYVGRWAPGETKTVTYRTGTGSQALAKSYPLELSFAYTEEDGESGLKTESASLTPLERQQYAVENVTHNVSIGDDGVFEVDVRNAGPRDVTDASVTLSTNDGVIAFDSSGSVGGSAVQSGGTGSQTTQAFVGDWAAGETRTMLARASVDEAAVERNYTIDATIQARDREDNTLKPRTRQFGFEPADEQTFAIENTEQSLRVGEDGTVLGTITNTGDRTARNVVVRYDSDLPNVFPRDTQYAVGHLAPGESAQFEFRIGLSEGAEAGPRVFKFQPRYRNAENDVQLADSEDIVVAVEKERDAFTVEPVDATFTPGETETLEMNVTNNRDERLTDIRVKAFTDTPLDSEDDEAFVTALDPGESTTVAVDLSVSGNALAKTYPVSVDTRYDDERNETQLSGTYRVPIEVTASGDDGPPLLILLGAVLVVGGLAVVFRGQVLALADRGSDGTA